MNKFVIHQAYYGEVNRAHSCITQTIDDSELTSFLIAFTDRPAALPPGVELTPYLSGNRFSHYYIFTKTFPDPSASRSGMVFTHVLIVNLSDIELIDSLNEIFSHFLDQIPQKKDSLKSISFVLLKKKFISENEIQPLYIQQSISYYINEPMPILFSGGIVSFIRVLQIFWNYPGSEARKNLKFRASFTPSDINDMNDLTIVFIQKDLSPKWSGYRLIHSENNELVEITSDTESLFLISRDDNPLHIFLIDLGVDFTNFENFKHFDKIFNDYKSLQDINDANDLRLDIRILSKISSNPQIGNNIKKDFINRLDELIVDRKDTNLKAIRNINWKAYKDGESKAKLILSNFIEEELNTNECSQIGTLSEILNISFNEKKKNWWHSTIHKTFRSVFTDKQSPIINNIWKLIDYNDETLNNLFIVLPENQKAEVLLRTRIPSELKPETTKALKHVTKKRKWYLLHADISLKSMQIFKAIINQKQLESDLEYKNSIGLKYLCAKLSDAELLELTLADCDSKLIHLIVDRILEKKSLLRNISTNLPCWLNIWASSLEKTQNISYGIEGNEKGLLYSILDLIISDKKVPKIIIKLFADSEFTDISNYPNRSECWDKLPKSYIDVFLNSTSLFVVNELITDNTWTEEIEEPLSDKISSDQFMTKFLSDFKNDIESVIKIYKEIPNLKDNFLADYITYFRGNISSTSSTALGVMISKKNMVASAESIYKKSKFNYSFKPAFENCRTLVKLNWWDEIWSFTHEPYRSNYNSGYQRESDMNESTSKSLLPTVVILTAIKEEYFAVRNHLQKIIDEDINDTAYEKGIFEVNQKNIANVVIRECGAKNTNASQETERAIQNFRPNCILFVGIAGSRKPNDFSIGDVIFPEKIYSYEGGKSEKESFRSRPDLASSTYTLTETAKKVRRGDDWKNFIKGDWGKEVKADLGIIASGEQIVEHYDSEIGKILTQHFNDTSAVEMEGFGFANAAMRQGRETSHILFGIVRGISDVLGRSGEDSENGDRRPDDVKNFASDTAAAFAYCLISKTYG